MKIYLLDRNLGSADKAGRQAATGLSEPCVET
jgi:hypothetical protein